MDWAGNFVAVWDDNRNVHNDIWMHKFDSDGNPIGGNQKVNDDFGPTRPLIWIAYVQNGATN
jgi:hypothetical protein